MKLALTILGREIISIALTDGEVGEHVYLAMCAEDAGGPAGPGHPIGRVTPEGSAVDVECVPTDDRFADWSELPDDRTRFGF